MLATRLAHSAPTAVPVLRAAPTRVRVEHAAGADARRESERTDDRTARRDPRVAQRVLRREARARVVLEAARDEVQELAVAARNRRVQRLRARQPEASARVHHVLGVALRVYAANNS